MKKGFTLVELSIVLVIIGLLIGGILVAQSMIATAKVTKVVRQVEQYKIAINLFKDRFKCLPGDCAKATDYFILNDIPEAASWYLDGGNGDGNGIITHNTHREDFLMWKELNQAGLLPGEYYGIYKSGVVDGGGNPLVLAGLNLPAGPYPHTAFGYNDSPVYYAGTLDNGLELGTDGNAYGLDDNALAPAEALAIDAKMDDSLPNAGNVAVRQTSNKVCRISTSNSPTDRYDPALDSAVSANRCSLFFNTDTY